MEKMTIEGRATISEEGFSFDSGMPSNEPVLEKTLMMRGALKVMQNGSAEFMKNRRVYLPPMVKKVGEGAGYSVKRTSRNYIVTMKVPVVESRKESDEKMQDMLIRSLGDITLDRHELLPE